MHSLKALDELSETGGISLCSTVLRFTFSGWQQWSSSPIALFSVPAKRKCSLTALATIAYFFPSRAKSYCVTASLLEPNQDNCWCQLSKHQYYYFYILIPNGKNISKPSFIQILFNTVASYSKELLIEWKELLRFTALVHWVDASVHLAHGPCVCSEPENERAKKWESGDNTHTSQHPGPTSLPSPDPEWAVTLPRALGPSDV